mmetsp:Transcript_5086/g.14294  ORF Transcript_5086/g.14294 Transcript_5086/m.14294 type:complete len:303 (-) Transcript_5086:268-1176(-)
MVRVGRHPDVVHPLRDKTKNLCVASVGLNLFVDVSLLQASENLTSPLFQVVAAVIAGVPFARVRDPILQAPVFAACLHVDYYLFLAVGREARVVHEVLQTSDDPGTARGHFAAVPGDRDLAGALHRGLHVHIARLQLTLENLGAPAFTAQLVHVRPEAFVRILWTGTVAVLVDVGLANTREDRVCVRVQGLGADYLHDPCLAGRRCDVGEMCLQAAEHLARLCRIVLPLRPEELLQAHLVGGFFFGAAHLVHFFGAAVPDLEVQAVVLIGPHRQLLDYRCALRAEPGHRVLRGRREALPQAV